MNSFVNVQVRVLAGQAMAQLAALEARVGGLEGGFGKATRGSNMFGSSLNGMRLDAFGSRIQWIGRQLEYNFTIPILAASAASMKLALDNETAFKRIEKVYGDAEHGADKYGKELQALQRNFKALSNEYGVNQTEVLNVAASWAAAGASGIALAKSVDLTMQTMILGEMKSAEATEALIAIQAQYGQSTGELTKTIATLNMVENQTGISLAGLVQGFSRAAGIARSAGVDVRHLAAMLAALTPASGSAAQAGNALKTIFSRLLSPTRETVEVLGLMGIKYDDLAWKSATVTQQLQILGKKFEDLSDKQKGVVSSVVASRWQVNKFEVLMRELINTNGYYQKALQGTQKETAVFAQMQKELNVVLSSNPRRLQIMWTILQNAMADIVQPMIPMLLWLATAVAKVVTAFSNLDPAMQKLIVIALLFLAAIGPIVRLTGAVILLFGQLGMVVGLLFAPFSMLGSAMWAIVKIPMVAALTAMGAAMRTTVLASVTAVAASFRWLGGVMSIAILTGLTQAGIVWRAGLGFMATFLVGWGTAFLALWRRTMAFLYTIMIATARALGVAWRTALAAIFLIQRAWGLLMLVSWTQLFRNMVLLAIAGFTRIIAVFRAFIPAVRAFSLAVMAAMTGPWGVAITAVIVLVIAFWDELKQAWSVIVRGTINAFNSLPAGIAGAMRAVVTVVQRAAMAVYNAFSWMNPWARHSPSLVDNVTTGVAEIKKQYNSIDEMANIFRRAGMSMDEVAQAVLKLKRAAQIQEFADNRKELEKYASSSVPMFNKLVSVLFPLQDLLKKVGREVAAQQAVVDSWKNKLDAANVALEQQQKVLSDLQAVAQGYKTKLDEAQAEMDRYANAPIQGMKAMSDAIFANEMQQKALRLEMLKMEKTVGPLDKLKSKLDAINGQMELLSGEQNALRSAGAGSEILSQYDEQIAALEDQQDAINAQILPLQNLSDQIEQLGRDAEMLDLEQSLQFDPLKRQIDDLVNSMEELPFEEILAGVTENKGKVDQLTEAYNNATQAVTDQQAVVDQYLAARDAIQASYDLENAKLESLKDQYSQIETQVRDIESALNDMAAAARAAGEAARAAESGGGRGMSPGAENFKAGAGGNFPDPGGFAQIGREGGFEDQSKMIDDFTKEMTDKTKNMFGMFNFLDPIKRGWNTAWGWVKDNVGGPIGDLMTTVKDKLGASNPFEGAKSWVDTAKNIWEGIKSAFKMIWDVIGPEVIKVGKEAWAGLQDAFKDIQPEIEKFRDLVGPMGEALNNVWTVLKPVLAIVLGLILMVVKALIGAISGAIGPFIRAIGDLIAGIVKILRGVIEVIVGVFTGDWKMAWEGIKDIFSGIWQAIWGVIKNFVNMIWGAVKGFVVAIYDFFVWLWDELVGHSVIPDMVNGIIDWFKKLVQWGKDLVKQVVDAIVKLWRDAWDAVSKKFGEAKTSLSNKLNEMKTLLSAAWKAFIEDIKAKWNAGWTAVTTVVTTAKTNITNRVNDIKTVASAAWNAFINSLKSTWDSGWNTVKSKIDWARGQINAQMDNIRGVINKLRDGWTSVVNSVKGQIDSMVSKFNGIKSRMSFGGMFDGIKSAFRSAINWVIGKWNNLSFPGISVAGVQLSPSIGTPNIGFLAKGGMIARHAMAVVGEGRSGYPEYVIPTDPMHRKRATALFGMLGKELGYAQSRSVGGHSEARMMSQSATGSQTETIEQTVENNYNFYGDLSFPNIKTVDDAERFIGHLESLAGGRKP